MSKVNFNKGLTRQILANPFQNEPMLERLKKVGTIDLRDNHRVTRLENGYDRIEYINRSKKH